MSQDFFSIHYSQMRDLFMRYGIKSITMDDIASHLQVSKKTLYEHFTTKENLLAQILDKFISEEIDISREILMTSDPLEGLQLFLDLVVEKLATISESTVYDMKKYYKRLWRKAETFRNEIILKNIIHFLSKCQENGCIRKEVIISLHAELFLHIIKSLVEDESRMTKEKKVALFNVFAENHITGLLTNSEKKNIQAHEH